MRLNELSDILWLFGQQMITRFVYCFKHDIFYQINLIDGRQNFIRNDNYYSYYHSHQYFTIILLQMFTRITGLFGNSEKPTEVVIQKSQYADQDVFQQIQTIGIVHSNDSQGENTSNKKQCSNPKKEQQVQEQMIVVRQSNDFGEYGQKNINVFPSIQHSAKNEKAKKQSDQKEQSHNKLTITYNYYDNDILNQSFSDLNQQQTQAKVFNEMNTKKQSPKQESRGGRDSESFSGIYDASQDLSQDFDDYNQQDNKHNEKQAPINKINKKDNQITIQQQKMKKMFTQSIRQQRPQPIVHKPSPKKKTEEPKKKLEEPKKIELKPEKVQQDLNLSQSTYLQKVQDENTRMQNLKKKRQSFNQVRVQKVDKYLIFKFEQLSIEITIDIMNQITEEFLKLEILVPLMHERVYETNHTLQFFKKYTDFINQKRSEHFIKIIKMLAEKSKKKDFKKRKNEATIFDSFRYAFSQKYSKTEKIYNTVNSKLQILKTLKELSNMQDLDSQINQNQELLGSLQLLLCFERAENFCKQKIQRSDIEKNIWMSRKNQLIKDRNWWITNVFPKVYI